ncbi:MAG: hypothetical protein LV481_09790 [Methylacidiphilales bacterium]|nr:hypothetical protein [Candidatus Methylacidiphilales bacterium]
MRELLNSIWLIGFCVGTLFLLAAPANKSLKRGDGYLEDAYKCAMIGGVILLISMIVMYIVQVGPDWH